MELDNKIYYVIGALIVANIGTIGSIVMFGARAIWFFAKMDARINEAQKDINAAHAKIRDLEHRVINH